MELVAKGERLSNVVLMGMGEPLGNYKNVLEAVRRINSEIGVCVCVCVCPRARANTCMCRCTSCSHLMVTEFP